MANRTCLQMVSKRFFHPTALKEAKGELTSVRYPHIKRGHYAVLQDQDVQYFERLLDKHRVISDPSELDGVNTDWLGMVKGASKLLLRPKTTEEISEILRHCNSRKLAVCPQGGNTGLVGGSVPVFDEIILSTSLMNNVISFEEAMGILVCQSGCVLEALDHYAGKYDYMMPLDLGAKGSCHIGGNVATNAGGIRLLRYGSLHGSVLGLEAVMASGEVLDSLSCMKKDNTGFDVKQLFIGSEGVLGVVTKVAIQCVPRPTSQHVAFLGLRDFKQCLETFQAAKRKLGEILSSCEFIDESALDSITGNLKLRSPIAQFPFYMLLETSGSNAKHDEEKMSDLLETLMNEKIVEDGTVASEPSHIQFTENLYHVGRYPFRGMYSLLRFNRLAYILSLFRAKAIWALRERIAEALLHDGYVYKYDVSLPVTQFYDLVPRMRERLGSDAVRCCGYGHLGDGNLHLNVTSREFDESVLSRIEPFIYEFTSSLKGSVSAEHGLGFKKRDFISYSKSPEAISLMKQLKRMMDPHHILNPYKTLPD